MDRFGPTGKVSKKPVHLLRWSSFPGRTGLNFGWMDCAQDKSNIKKMWVTFSCQQRFVEEHIHENVPTFKGGNYKTHEEMSSVVIFICRGYKLLELTGYRIIWLKISGMPLGKKVEANTFFFFQNQHVQYYVFKWINEKAICHLSQSFWVLIVFFLFFPFSRRKTK